MHEISLLQCTAISKAAPKKSDQRCRIEFMLRVVGSRPRRQVVVDMLLEEGLARFGRSPDVGYGLGGVHRR
jgi:hypothetical protein